MTLPRFLDATAISTDAELRRAMAAALALEVPRDHDGYTRFYRRVLDQLDAERRDPRHVMSTHLTHAA